MLLIEVNFVLVSVLLYFLFLSDTVFAVSAESLGDDSLSSIVECFGKVVSKVGFVLAFMLLLLLFFRFKLLVLRLRGRLKSLLRPAVALTL